MQIYASKEYDVHKVVCDRVLVMEELIFPVI
jgi:hypothetical protein